MAHSAAVCKLGAAARHFLLLEVGLEVDVVWVDNVKGGPGGMWVRRGHGGCALSFASQHRRQIACEELARRLCKDVVQAAFMLQLRAAVGEPSFPQEVGRSLGKGRGNLNGAGKKMQDAPYCPRISHAIGI